MQRSHWLVAGAATITILCLALPRSCAARGTSEASTTSIRSSAAGASPKEVPVGPLRVVHGVAEGWRHDGAGARAAAISAVQLSGPIAKAGFITRDDMIDALSSKRFGPTFASRSALQLADFLQQVGTEGLTPSELLWSELPLTARLVHADQRRAQVQVWSVLVLGAPRVGVPRQAWRTVTVDLTWEDEDWKIDGWSSTTGPTPVLGDDAAGASLEDLSIVTGWPQAAESPGGK